MAFGLPEKMKPTFAKSDQNCGLQTPGLKKRKKILGSKEFPDTMLSIEIKLKQIQQRFKQRGGLKHKKSGHKVFNKLGLILNKLALMV